MDSWLQHWQLRFIACVPLFRHLREKLKDTFSIRSEKNGSVLGLGSQTPNLQTHFRIRSYFISLISISRTIDLCRATLYIARPIPYAAVYVRLYLYQCIALSRKRYKIGCGTPIGTRVRCIEWCHFQWPRMTHNSHLKDMPLFYVEYLTNGTIYIYYYAEAANSGQNHTVQHNTAHSSQIKKGTNNTQ